MKIAVYAICKNEEHNVEEFLENVKDADDVVICDTGSTDCTWDLLIGYGPRMPRPREDLFVHPIRVEPFRFDVARNAALALVPANVDVCISLDMDERLSPGWRETIEKAWEKHPDITRLSVNYETVGFKSFLHNSRIHKRTGYYWTDPCHEVLAPWMADEVEAVSKSLTITHKPDLTKPRTRMPLLEAGIAEQPWNRRRLFYYGRELVLAGRHREGLRILRHYLKLWAKSGEAAWWETDQAEAYIRLAEGCLLEQGEAISPSAGDQTTPPQSSEA